MSVTVAPIMQALVQKLRSSAALKAALLGGIHEGPQPPDEERYPWLTYGLHYGTVDYSWGSALQTPGFDIFVFSRDQVEARNLDALVADLLHDAALSVAGQSTLYCRRTLNMSFAVVDEESQKVYQVGGVYEVWTDQGL